jgi:2-keto-4-pentenoate hydratase
VKRAQRRAALAGARLFDAHRRGEPFAPLPAELAPRTREEAYAIQDTFVALRADALGPVVGFKIALTTPQMRRMAGIEHPLSGAVLETTVRRSPARVRAADYQHLLVEFEIAVELAEDLPVADAPFSREHVARAVGAVLPSFELADDRHADYARLPHFPLELIADNAWNEGAVLGEPRRDWRGLDLAALRGVVHVNGKRIGEGVGADALGHPLEAVAWVANHFATAGRGLWKGCTILTGSLVKSYFPAAGDELRFALDGLGEVVLNVD